MYQTDLIKITPCFQSPSSPYPTLEFVVSEAKLKSLLGLLHQRQEQDVIHSMERQGEGWILFTPFG